MSASDSGSESKNAKRLEDGLNQLNSELKRRDRAEKAKPLGVVVASVVVILAIVGGIWLLATRGNDDHSDEAAATTEAQPEFAALRTSRETPLPPTVTCEYPSSGRDAAKQVSVPNTKDVPTTGEVTVTLNTNDGPIPMQLNRAVSPCTVNAIEHLAKQKYYDNTVCHRITTSGIHVLQCGDPSGTGSGGPGFTFADEYPIDDAAEAANPTVDYPRGSIAMANSGPNTNGSQFFLNYDSSPLPPAYTYFGEVSEEGLKTLDTIAERGAEGGASDGKPAQEVKISSASVS